MQRNYLLQYPQESVHFNVTTNSSVEKILSQILSQVEVCFLLNAAYLLNILSSLEHLLALAIQFCSMCLVSEFAVVIYLTVVSADARKANRNISR
jgi:hypothetical protein